MSVRFDPSRARSGLGIANVSESLPALSVGHDERPSALEIVRPAWQQHAACRGMGAEVFFPPRGRDDLVKQAKAICAGCPVKVDCLEYALDVQSCDRAGIWAGTNDKTRRRIRRERRLDGAA